MLSINGGWSNSHECISYEGNRTYDVIVIDKSETIPLRMVIIVLQYINGLI